MVGDWRGAEDLVAFSLHSDCRTMVELGLCVGVAAKIAGTLVQECARPAAAGEAFRVGHGSGVLPVEAVVTRRRDGWFAERTSVYRTARVLMEGRVFAPVDDLEAVG